VTGMGSACRWLGDLREVALVVITVVCVVAEIGGEDLDEKERGD
jgi:hypothetical protein